MTTQIVYSEKFSKHDNPRHPENAQRLSAMINELKKTPFFNELEFIEPELLREECLYDVHSSEMIQQVKEMSRVGDSWIDFDTYVCKSDYETARLAAGGLLKLCKNVLNGKSDNGYALIRPPGHHATKNRSMGFCLFNNIAIAANELSKKGKKVLIFDPDVHHGNGTQDIFYDRKNVMYQSIHLSPHYPGTGGINEIGIGEGEGYTINAPLSHGYGDKAVSKILEKIFLPIASQFKPAFIMFSTGFDSHHMDPLGGLKFTTNFYGEMVKRYQEIQPKIVSTIEGGYNLQSIGKCLVSQIGQMVNHPIYFDDKTDENSDVEALIDKLRDAIGSYWKL
jgi:acetoin utilization deacetylase AcuC-like enzyme